MSNNFANPSYTIPAGAALSGTLHQARRIQVACGRVWLTVAGAESDFWLQAGESMVVPANRLVVIEADRQASLLEMEDACVFPQIQRTTATGFASYLQSVSKKLKAQVFA